MAKPLSSHRRYSFIEVVINGAWNVISLDTIRNATAWLPCLKLCVKYSGKILEYLRCLFSSCMYRDS